MPMHYRRFGRTDLQMPVLSTGGMRYQDGWKDKPLDEVDPDTQANLEATIRRSLELGINHIETARGYGPSERQLGVILPTLPRDEIIVQTKVGPTADPDEFTRNVEASLERLQLDYVDLLGLHGLNNGETIDHAVGVNGKPGFRGGCLAAARELQRKGKVRHVGFSTHGTLDEILRAVTHDGPGGGGGGFDYINLHYYFIFRRHAPVIAEATRRDMGIFIISPSDKGGKLYDPPERLVELCRPLHPIVFNDLWCLRDERVQTLSVGAARPSDYDLHAEAVALLDRADELVPPIEARLREEMAAATGEADPEAFSWAGVPEYHDAPAGLNLPIMLWLNSLAAGWDMQAYGKMRFNLLGSGSHWFAGADPHALADVPDADLADALANSPHAARLPTLLRESVQRLAGEKVKRQSEGG